MRVNETLRLLRDGRPAFGTWLQLYSPAAARLLAAQGCFHWMLVDFEHTPVDYPTAATMFSSISDISQGQITPLARVATGSVEQIKQALDCGAQGVIAPMVNTAEDAAQVVRYARFPPEGERGAGGLAPHLGFGVNRPDYLVQANRETLVAVQIETRQAVDNIASILAVPGLDMVFIGPNDLHMSLGMPAKFWSDAPQFLHAVRSVTAACQDAGIPYGTLCRDTAAVRPRLSDGFTFVGIGSDAHFMLTHAGEQYGDLHGIPEPAETWCNRVGVFGQAPGNPGTTGS
ncbi:HpcH/HpaI aldolase/citrate lyase family protein [Streptomyces sp. NPDC056069]|uniref:HpcH/HpaI aldolase family protein n=1 Tax=Streptomyces sp. NPDC056069 TaxID=3345702 RepID=UPI0035DD0DB6